jgi:hypothetical protein
MGSSPVEAGQEFERASKSKKFIRSCGPVNARNSIVIAKMHDAGNGVLQVSGGAEYFHSLVGQIDNGRWCWIFALHLLPQILLADRNLRAWKISFLARNQSIIRCSPSRQNIYFFFSEIMYDPSIPPRRRGRFAVVTDVGCGMRWACRVAT